MTLIYAKWIFILVHATNQRRESVCFNLLAIANSFELSDMYVKDAGSESKRETERRKEFTSVEREKEELYRLEFGL